MAVKQTPTGIIEMDTVVVVVVDAPLEDQEVVLDRAVQGVAHVLYEEAHLAQEGDIQVALVLLLGNLEEGVVGVVGGMEVHDVVHPPSVLLVAALGEDEGVEDLEQEIEAADHIQDQDRALRCLEVLLDDLGLEGAHRVIQEVVEEDEGDPLVEIRIGDVEQDHIAVQEADPAHVDPVHPCQGAVAGLLDPGHTVVQGRGVDHTVDRDLGLLGHALSLLVQVVAGGEARYLKGELGVKIVRGVVKAEVIFVIANLEAVARVIHPLVSRLFRSFSFVTFLSTSMSF